MPSRQVDHDLKGFVRDAKRLHDKLSRERRAGSDGAHQERQKELARR